VARHTFVVFTNAADGRDDEFNDWYNNRHLHDLLSTEGFVAAQRFRLADMNPGQDFAHQYLALYEVETEDLEKTNRAMREAANDGRMFISPALDRKNAVARYFTPITDRVVATPSE
jgi:hypothetical protein